MGERVGGEERVGGSGPVGVGDVRLSNCHTVYVSSIGGVFCSFRLQPTCTVMLQLHVSVESVVVACLLPQRDSDHRWLPINMLHEKLLAWQNHRLETTQSVHICFVVVADG